MERHIKNQHQKGEGKMTEDGDFEGEEEEEEVNVIDEFDDDEEEEDNCPKSNSIVQVSPFLPYCEEKFNWISTLKEHLASSTCNNGGPFKARLALP
ncbi:Pebbled, partial [Caligus rogercresseyi]